MRARLAELVAVQLEHAQRRVDDPLGALRGGVGAGLEADQLALDPRAGAERRVGGGQLDRLGEHRLGLGQAACVEQRRAQPGQERRAGGVAGSDQARGALEQAGNGWAVAAGLGGVGGRLQPRRGGAAQLAFALADRGEVREQQVGLGEVVPDRLVAGAGRRLEPARDALVQLGAALLRQPW